MGYRLRSRGAEMDDQPTADSTPEDVAVLYTWANLQGAKYRDYSASRREYRARGRYRAAKSLLESELKAQAEAEAAADQAARMASAAQALAQITGDRPPEPQVSAEEAARKAAADRVEAARRAESTAHAAVLALREEREIAEARTSARRQAMLYAEAESRRRLLAGPQPDDRKIEGASTSAPGADSSPDQDSSRPNAMSTWAAPPFMPVDPSPEPVEFAPLQRSFAEIAGSDFEIEQTSPAWLYASQTPPQARTSQPFKVPANALGVDARTADTLQDSRERVAARWFALKQVFEHGDPELPALQPFSARSAPMPLVAVFSLAGGVGKTSLVATLARALSSRGENVLLADTTSHGLLPFYFGERALNPGVVQTFSRPSETSAPHISLVAHDAASMGADERQQEILKEDILRDAQGSHRLLLDISSGSSWLIRRLAGLHPTVLIPVAPDMNSVISLQPVERIFRSIADSAGRPVLPFYVLNQFDAALPLHLDVRELFRRQLGDRLLRIAIRRSPKVSEALAQGMTVLDYAPSAPVAQDFLDVAAWLTHLSPPARPESLGVSWGDR
jgi:cellulose synthase operon protein YhjQ